MQKMALSVIIVVSLVGIGIGLSIYGNQIVFEDLVTEMGQINKDDSLMISAEISRENERGIYAVEIINFKEGTTISAKVLDPFNSQVASKQITVERFEERFDITDDGIYQLVLESNSEEDLQVFGVIGPEPDPGKQSVGFISFYVLIVGLVGMAIVALYAIKNKRR